MTTLQQVELGVLGPLQVRQYGLPVAIPGAKPRAILTMLGLHGGSVVSADTLLNLLWGDDPPRTAAKALQTHISSLRRTLGDGFVLTQGSGWTLDATEIDAIRYQAAVRLGRAAVAAGDPNQAAARFDEALALWRGVPELPDGPRGDSEKTRWIEGHAALVEDRADALLVTGRAAEIIGELEAAVADGPLRERRWGQLMLALYRAGRQGEALAAFQRARSLLADELGVDPGPELRRLEAAVVAQDPALEVTVAQQLSSVTRAVTFLLTDIEGSTAAWEADADAMGVALARHDEIVEQVVTSRGGRLVKTRGEGDATFSVFDRPSAAAAAAVELQDVIAHEPWALAEPMRIRVALHTGEVELRDGDYFGRAVNRAARLRSLAGGGQILCSGATAELVVDTLADDVALVDLGMRRLKNLARPEHVFELRLETAEMPAPTTGVPTQRPALPAVLTGAGPFVGRTAELARLLTAWQAMMTEGTQAVLIAGEPGVGKTRLAGEWARHGYEQGAAVLYGRCDEDLGAPYQPFAEALRILVPCLDPASLRRMRGVEALLPLVPGLSDVVADLAAAPRADPDTERYALFDAVVALLNLASASVPVVLVLDDLHWAAKPTLLLLRHLLRFGEHARVQIVGTYRSTDLDRSHPLAAMLADLHRDGCAHRLALGGLDQDDVTAYVAEAGYDDEELARALASVTGGNPFFLIEALRHVDESGGRWDAGTLPQGVREAVSRRLSRLSGETNKALAAAAVVGSRFGVELVERVVGEDLVDAFDEAGKAGIVIEEPGGRYRFNHAIVRQSLLTELPAVRRMRLHQRIAAELESQGADDELLAELAYHYFECAWAGNAAKAVEYCRRAADQAMARLAYEGAADLYDKALHALEELDDELPDRDDLQAELLIARCEALLAAGDMVTATGAVAQLRSGAGDSARLDAWGTCFESQLSMLTDPERLDEIESAVRAAAESLAALSDAAGEAAAHTVRAACLARLGRIGDCEAALDQALTAARRAGDHRRVNAVLAGAPLAALWGPNPVPRAGGRCLDVVRLLRITTGSPVVEATSTRCQGVLDAFRGRAAAGRQLIDSARRSLNELGMRHAVLEVDQFAGIVELVADEPEAAERHLRRAYAGFRRMGLDADAAESAALLARACLLLGRDGEADELCTASEGLAGHALKAAIAWRTVRAQLLSRQGRHDDARRVAEAAVAMAERTDALVDHGDACLALATVLDAAGDAAGARAAAERAVGLYERKGAAALADKARALLGATPAVAAALPDAATAELTNACVRIGDQLVAAVNREDWAGVAQFFAPRVALESRRRVVGFARIDLPSARWPQEMKRFFATGMVRYRTAAVAVRGERLALVRLHASTADPSSGAPEDQMLQVVGLDEEGRIARQVWFDVDDIDAAIAELDAEYARVEATPLRPPLENTATRVSDRINSLIGQARWDQIGVLFSEGVCVDDRRRGLRREGNDRATEVANLRELTSLGVNHISRTTKAVRGDRLGLSHLVFEGLDTRGNSFESENLAITEVGADGSIVGIVAFDVDDFDDAIGELDLRYVAGEAAQHANIWSLIARTYAALNGEQLPPTTAGFTVVDHRGAAAMAPAEGAAFFRASWELAAQLHVFIEAVHRLSDLGAVFTHVGRGTSREGFEAEWRTIDVITVDGDTVSRCELYDETELHAALARFDELSRPVPRVANTASQVWERFNFCLTTGDWNGLAATMADDFCADDRRRVVGAGVLQGRDAAVAHGRITAELGVANSMSTVVAVRGDRVALIRARFWGRDEPADAFSTEVLHLVEIDGEQRLTTFIGFDVDDMDSALAELDSRYGAGEAAPHAEVWSVIVGGFAAATAPDFSTYIEAVHRLTEVGVVVTQVAHGTTEWRIIAVLAVDGGTLKRCEVFDETDLDGALQHFDELREPAPRLHNAAARALERFSASFRTRDWPALAAIMADDMRGLDRRKVVGAGLRQGRERNVADWRAVAELGTRNITHAVVATRGEYLAVCRLTFSGDDQRPEAFRTDTLGLIEITAEERIAATTLFDIDDIDAAFGELESRYLAGEAGPHARIWTLVTRTYAGFNRHELSPRTPDWMNVDHRRGLTHVPGDMAAFVSAAWDVAPNINTRIEAVHRLSSAGAVFTHAESGSTQQGFDTEWREVALLMFDGDLISRCEIFDEADLDAALARLDELSSPTTCLENAASRVYARFNAHHRARDWEAMAAMLTDDVLDDDRRRVVSAGIRRGRDAQIANLQAITDVGVRNLESVVIATRGQRLVLARTRVSGGRQPEAFGLEMLTVVEIDITNRISAGVMFDVDDIDAAFDELESRYITGEAADSAHTWSVVAGIYTGLNRHEIPAVTRDCVNIDHRRAIGFSSGEVTAYIDATLGDVPDFRISIEKVHQLSTRGAVVTFASSGRSRDGFDAEWRMIQVLIVDGDRIERCEFFDEADVDAALARFGELSRPARHVENAASEMTTRFQQVFRARDWDGMAAIFAEDITLDDRRQLVGVEFRGRDATIGNMRASAETGVTNVTSTVVATRGPRLALQHAVINGKDDRPGAFRTEAFVITEIDTQAQIIAFVMFDDIDSAVAELDARYLAAATRFHNAATRARALVADAYNRRNGDTLLVGESRYEDRRKGLRDEGVADARYIHALLAEIPATWRMELEPVAIRGDHLALTRETFRDTDEVDWPITGELLTLTHAAGDESIAFTVFFDPDDIDGAMAEITSRWIASGEVAHPEIIESACRSIEAYNRRDWDAVSAIEGGAAYVNHRRLAGADPETIAEHWLSIRTLASLIPDMRIELAEVLTHSPTGLVGHVVVTGTTAEGAAIELPAIVLSLYDGTRVERMEAFDVDQRDVALARFAELHVRRA